MASKDFRRLTRKSDHAEMIYTCYLCHHPTRDLETHSCRIAEPSIVYAQCRACRGYTYNLNAHLAHPCEMAVSVMANPPVRRTTKLPAARPRPARADTAAPRAAPKCSLVFIIDASDAAHSDATRNTLIDYCDFLQPRSPAIGVVTVGTTSAWTLSPTVAPDTNAIAEALAAETHGKLALYDAIVRVSEAIPGELIIVAVVSDIDRASRNKCDQLLDHLHARTNITLTIMHADVADRNGDYAKICSGRGVYITAPAADVATVLAASL